MVIFNENGIMIDNPDQNLGYIENKLMNVIHTYIVDEPAVTHEVVIQEYPETGGKDVEIVVDVPQQGHWETTDQNGKPIPEFDGDLTGFPRDVPVPNTWEYGVYIPYTEEELEQRAQDQEKLVQETEKREEFMQNAPSQIEELEANQEDMILLMADIVGGAV